MFKIIFSRSSKCSKTTVALTFSTQKANACSTQKANACSPWTDCSVFDRKYPSWVKKLNFGPKTHNCQFKLKIGT